MPPTAITLATCAAILLIAGISCAQEMHAETHVAGHSGPDVPTLARDNELARLAPSTFPSAEAVAAPQAGSHFGPFDDSHLNWLRIPQITPTPRAGWFTLRNSGPGYYTLLDWLEGEPQQDAPPAPFGLTSSNQTPSYDHDFRYLDKPDNAYHQWSDFYKRVHIDHDFLFSTGGEVRYRFNDYTNTQLTGLRDQFDLTRVRTYGDLMYRDQFRAFVEMIDARSFDQDLPPNPTDTTATTLLNAFVELKAADVAGSPIQIRGGRQEIVIGSQRLIASPDFSNTLRTYDGLRAYRHSEKWSVDMFWVRPVIPNPTQFASSDDQRAFSGLYVTHRPNTSTLIDAYLLNLNDSRMVSVGDTTTFGGRFAGDIDKRLLFDFEAMAQTGTRVDKTISAQALTTGLGWHFAELPWNISFWTYYDYASGTQDPNSGVHRTFNQLFPAGHTYFGYLDLVGRQNIEDLNFQLQMNPQPWFQFRTQFHIMRLAASKDALYNAAGVPIRHDPTGAAGTDVGNEIDFLGDFHLTPHQDISVGYSQLFAGSFIKATGPGSDPTFFYTQYTFRW